MCGIAGILSREPIETNRLAIKSMTDSLAHRGPDDAGITFSSFASELQIAFGHRRLRIIDLSAGGHQPMSNAANTLCITYNGEIYNYLELKEELVKKGHAFATASDTEVVLKAYEEWGVDCFARFNGMWAMAIFDKNRQKIILSRDRFGQKPLYYYRTDKELVFASEIKALLKHPKVVKKPNYEKIFRYIAYSYRYVDIDESSFFKDIYQIPKSSFLEVDEQLNMHHQKYWQIDPSRQHDDISDHEAIREFKDLLVDAVKIRLRSDVPVGCMLSGGMDSTSITSIAYKILGKSITTFSGVTGAERGVYDESEYIDSIIKDVNADFHYIRPEPADIFETVDKMLYYHDEPICTVTWYSLFLIAEKIGQEAVPVILNGHAGDELLGGYWDHYHYHFFDLAQEGNLQALVREEQDWKVNHQRNPSELQANREYIENLANHRAKETERFPDYSGLFRKEVNAGYQQNIDLDVIAKDSLQRRLYLETFYETIPASLRPEDRNTMSQSIESRSPFLDYRLAEFCFSLPGRFKIRNGLGKWLLRESMKDILPEDVRTRKDKAGFIAPADDWFRTVNKKQIQNLINSPSLAARSLFDISKVNNMFEEHLAGERNHQMVLWQLINLELWSRRFFD